MDRFKYTGAKAAGWELETGAYNRQSLDGVSNIEGQQQKQGLIIGRALMECQIYRGNSSRVGLRNRGS
jgi:hypothetical protein